MMIIGEPQCRQTKVCGTATVATMLASSSIPAGTRPSNSRITAISGELFAAHHWSAVSWVFSCGTLVHAAVSLLVDRCGISAIQTTMKVSRIPEA